MFFARGFVLFWLLVRILCLFMVSLTVTCITFLFLRSDWRETEFGGFDLSSIARLLNRFIGEAERGLACYRMFKRRVDGLSRLVRWFLRLLLSLVIFVLSLLMWFYHLQRG